VGADGPGQHPDILRPASQLWIRKHGDAPWVIDLPLTPDRDGRWVNKFIPDHVGHLEEVTWVAADQLRYLNPEIVLLFKARLRRTKDERDLARTWPLLPEDKQLWLREMLCHLDDNTPGWNNSAGEEGAG
jgi:hypothetical protein